MDKIKKLIINADDFGISEATNKAIKELFIDKKITSTSLLANAMSTDEAIAIFKDLGLNVGVHLTLNSDFTEKPWRALSSGGNLSSIYDENFNLHYDTKIISRAKSIDVTLECEAQIKRIQDSGVEIDHLDNHSGTMYGINKRLFFINAFRLARKYNLPFRFPRSNNFLAAFFPNGIPSYIKIAHKAVVGTARVMGVRLIDDMITNVLSIKDISSYKELEEGYLKAITNMNYGLTEMFLHPSYPCPILSPLTNEWKKREYELEFLYSDALRNRLRDEGIELISYRDVK